MDLTDGFVFTELERLLLPLPVYRLAEVLRFRSCGRRGCFVNLVAFLCSYAVQEEKDDSLTFLAAEEGRGVVHVLKTGGLRTRTNTY